MSRIRLDDGVEPDTLFVFCAAVCTYASVSVLSIGNIFYMRRDAREALVKQKLEYLASYMETVSRAERESRRIRHDKRHHDACIAAMARAGDTDGILRYLEQEQAVAENFPAWCPHPMVNELLRSYAEKAKAAGVAFTAQADTPAQSDVADVDFVAILANLLENALHACTAAHSAGPIRVHIRNVGKKTVLAVSNPCVNLKLENGLPADGFVFDTALAAYLLDATAGSYDLGRLFVSYYNAELPKPLYLEPDAFSLLGVLGLWDPSLPFPVAEVSRQCPPGFSSRPDLKDVRLIVNSDAHYLDQIADASQYLYLPEWTPRAVLDWLLYGGEK